MLNVTRDKGKGTPYMSHMKQFGSEGLLKIFSQRISDLINVSVSNKKQIEQELGRLNLV